jgi:hypothetical protein
MNKKNATILLTIIFLMVTASCSYLQVSVNNVDDGGQDTSQNSEKFPIIDMHMHTFQ